MKKSIFFLSFTLLTLCRYNSLTAQTPTNDVWGTNGSVATIASDASYTYIGGSFSSVGPNIGHGAKLTTASSVPDMSFPKVNGQIYTCASDGSGGWYIGGVFTQVGNKTRNNLVHINSSGVVTAWNPNADGPVESIAISGSDIYVGGYFTTINGQARNNIAKLNNTDGAADGSWNPNADDAVATLAISGSDIYAGGDFNTIDGQTRNHIAKLNKTDGTADGTWTPNPNYGVTTIAISGSEIYVGGYFTTIGGQSRTVIAKLNNSDGAADVAWNAGANGNVTSIAISGSDIYVVGSFTQIGGQSRNNLVKLNDTNGAADVTWNPDADGIITSIAISGSDICIVGEFTHIGGQSRNNIAKLNNSDGAADVSWNPNAGGAGYSIAISGSDIYVGGYFTIMGGQTRNNIARINYTNGTVDVSWNPNANTYVNTIAISGSDIYVGGAFNTIGGQTRNYIAKLNNTNGDANSSWDPDADNNVRTIAISGSDIYVGGQFTSIGGKVRNYIAKLNNTNGDAVVGWNPNADVYVQTIAISGNDIYAGGLFTSIGGKARIGIAKLNNTNGDADANWTPNSDDAVVCITISGINIYVGGYFSSIGGQARSYIAKLNNTDGAADGTWNPSPDGFLASIAISGNDIYAGGSFMNIGGQTRYCIAKLNNTDGSAVGAWNPKTDNPVYSLAISDGNLYVGGVFTNIGGLAWNGFAKFSFDDIWTGASSTDWNTAGNWNANVVPTFSDNVIIPNVTNDPVVTQTGASFAACNNLSILSGAMLTIAPGKALTVNGTLANAGDMVLQSYASGTGSLIHHSSGVTATVEQYVSGNSNLDANVFHLVSIPVQVVNPVSGLFLHSYLYKLDAAQQESTNNNYYGKWVGLGTPSDIPLNLNQGYMVYWPYDAPGINIFSGSLTNGDYSLAVSGHVGTYTFNLVPNPYPSAVNWGAADGWTKSSGVGGSCYVWSATSGNYITLAAGATNYIPVGQAFIVLVNDEASPTITVKNAARTHSTQAFYKSAKGISNQLSIKADANGYADVTSVAFSADATDDFDLQTDGIKINGLDNAPQIYTLSANRKYSFNNLPVIQDELNVDMNFETKFNGQVSLTISGIESFDPSINIYLKDQLSNQTINLRNQQVYTFVHNTENAANRFKLIFGSPNGIDDNESPAGNMWITGCTLFINTHNLVGEKAMVEVFNVIGQSLMAKNLVLNGLSSLDLNTQGVVIVRLTSGRKVLTAKGVILK